MTMAALGTLIGWRSWLEARSLAIETIAVPIESDSGLSGLSVLHISDIHATGGDTWSLRALAELVDLEPDLIAVTGDLITSRDGLKPTATALAALRPKFGTHVVLGNHDHYHGTLLQRLTGAIGPFSHPDEIAHELESHGLNVLINSNQRLQTQLGPIQLVGTDDPFFGLSNVDLAYKGTHQEEPVLLLSHSPDTARQLNGYRCDLMLSGHTHGGQILVPMGLVAAITNTELKLTNPYGLMVLDGVLTHVSPGIGTANIPFRFNCPPRATLLKLTEV